jgi:hypothetical protein
MRPYELANDGLLDRVLIGKTRQVRAAELEAALREELARRLPDPNLNEALRGGLRQGLQAGSTRCLDCRKRFLAALRNGRG